MSHRIDMVGVKYGRLTAVSPDVTNLSGRLAWLFRCDCGNELNADGRSVRSGNTKSCGCLATEVKRTKAVTHGLSRHPIHAVWNAMIQRCYKSSCKSFSNYGGHGISVCERWHTFENFVADMGFPGSNMTIERIDNDGHYSPDNCKWATRKEQNNNTRQNVRIQYGDEEMTVAQWADKAGIKVSALRARLKRGVPFPFCILNMNLHAEMYGRFS